MLQSPPECDSGTLLNELNSLKSLVIAFRSVLDLVGVTFGHVGHEFPGLLVLQSLADPMLAVQHFPLSPFDAGHDGLARCGVTGFVQAVAEMADGKLDQYPFCGVPDDPARAFGAERPNRVSAILG